MSGGTGLLRKALHGLAWVFSAMVAARLVTFASNLALARLLAPDAFGVVAIPLLVITYFETVGDLGMGAALVRQQRDEKDAALVTFGFNLGLGALWGALMWLLAAPIASFFDRPDALGAIQALALVHPLKALGNTHDALLLHDLSFRRRALPEILRAVVKALVAIALALAGFGFWSLAWGQLAGTLAWVVSQWAACPWRPWEHLSPESLARARESARPMLGFGSQIVFVNVLAGLLHHSDKVLVGRLAGVAPLGLYTQAAKFPEAAITTLTWAVGRVTFPAFARSEGSPADRENLYLSALRLVAIATLPSAAVLALLAHPVVIVALGRQWEGAAPMLAALSLAAAFRSLGSHAGDLFKGAGRADLLRNLALLKVAVMLPVTCAAGLLTGSATAIAWAFAAGTLCTSAINLVVASRLLALPLRRIAREIAPSAALAAALGALLLALAPLTSSWAPALDLLARGGAAAVAGAAGLLAVAPELRSLPSRIRARAARRAGGTAP